MNARFNGIVSTGQLKATGKEPGSCNGEYLHGTHSWIKGSNRQAFESTRRSRQPATAAASGVSASSVAWAKRTEILGQLAARLISADTMIEEADVTLPEPAEAIDGSV